VGNHRNGGNSTRFRSSYYLRHHSDAAKPESTGFGQIRFGKQNTGCMVVENMFVLGVFILLFLIVHLYQFWYNMQFKELLQLPGAREDSAQLVTEVLSNGWVLAIYIVAFAALWLHLTHGFWSALQTIGWNNTKWMKRIKVIGNNFCLPIFVSDYDRGNCRSLRFLKFVRITKEIRCYE